MELEAIAKLIAKPAIKESMPIFNKLKDRVCYAFNDGLLDYFETSLNKYKEIKTLLHRQPTSFYDVYFPAKLTTKESDDIIETDSIKNLFKDGNFITIIGDAGSGKSTLLKHLFISSFVEYFQAPILVNLRDLNEENCSLDKYLVENILDNKLSPSENFLEKLLKSGEFLFFLDGYDEINSENKHDITKKLERFIDKYPKNKYVLTSRPYSSIEFFKNFRNLHILDLSPDDQLNFIKQQIINDSLSDKIIGSLEEAAKNNIDSYFKNPLLLTLYIMAYSKNSSIPNKKYIFYRRVFDVLFAEHDSATKVGFEREIKTLLNQEVLESVLQIFCFLSFFDSKFDFKKDYINTQLTNIKEKTEVKFRNNDFIEDMILSIGLWSEDSGVYAFSHRSMQEYFVSTYLSNMGNEKNKKLVYKKILELAPDRKFDTKNFLNLCYEMDEKFYINNYALPMIGKVKKLLLNANGKYNLKFTYLNQGFHHHSDHFEGSNLSYVLSKDIFLALGVDITPNINFNFLSKIANKLYSLCSVEGFETFFNIIKTKHNAKTEEEESTTTVVSLKNSINNEQFYTFLNQQGMFTIFDEVISEFVKYEKELKQHLEQEETIESSFATMI